jgi:hypothetical protein
VARKAKTSEPPPLADPTCLASLETGHKLMAERIGDPYIAAFELTKALASGEVPFWTRRRETGYKPEPGSSAFWADSELRWAAEEDLHPERRALRGLRVSLCRLAKAGGRLFEPSIRTFFLRLSDVDRICPPKNPEPKVSVKPLPSPKRKPKPTLPPQPPLSADDIVAAFLQAQRLEKERELQEQQAALAKAAAEPLGAEKQVREYPGRQPDLVWRKFIAPEMNATVDTKGAYESFDKAVEAVVSLLGHSKSRLERLKLKAPRRRRIRIRVKADYQHWWLSGGKKDV